MRGRPIDMSLGDDRGFGGRPEMGIFGGVLGEQMAMYRTFRKVLLIRIRNLRVFI